MDFHYTWQQGMTAAPTSSNYGKVGYIICMNAYINNNGIIAFRACLEFYD